MRGSRGAAAVSALMLVVFAGCNGGDGSNGRARTQRTTRSTRAVAIPPSSSTATTTTTIMPPTSAAAPLPYVGVASTVTAADLPSTYRAGCPVAPPQLRMLALSYWGYDAAPHTGKMVVSAAVAGQVIDVFHRLYNQRFPIRQMRPVDEFAGSDEDSLAADNTAGFNCRNVVAAGPPRWSVHAYGEAIDVNPMENPYLEGGRVHPAVGTAYLDRSVVRPGMAEPGGVLNEAFGAVRWQWGGRWASPDYQHFSRNGG